MKMKQLFIDLNVDFDLLYKRKLVRETKFAKYFMKMNRDELNEFHERTMINTLAISEDNFYQLYVQNTLFNKLLVFHKNRLRELEKSAKIYFDKGKISKNSYLAVNNLLSNSRLSNQKKIENHILDLFLDNSLTQFLKYFTIDGLNEKQLYVIVEYYIKKEKIMSKEAAIKRLFDSLCIEGFKKVGDLDSFRRTIYRGYKSSYKKSK